MPDPSAFDRIVMRPLMENPENPEIPDRGRGGIVKYSPNYRNRSVEIRPPRWGKKIWIGKLETPERAQYAADAVRFYVGMPPFHFEKGVMTLPAITCIGTVIGTPVELSTQEMCAKYVRAIAKGQDFKPQRDDFKQQMIKVVKNPDFPFLAPPRTEVVVPEDDDNDREDEFEFDDYAAEALLMSSHSGSSGVPEAVVQTLVAGPDSVSGSEAVQAYIPSFGIDSNGSENILGSAGQSICANLFSMDDCPTISSEDEKSWIEELDKLTAAGISTPSVACNDGEVCRDGYETSPILNIPRSIMRPCASTSSKFFGTRVERAVPARTALGSSSDWPASQFAMMNAKRQKIGD